MKKDSTGKLEYIAGFVIVTLTTVLVIAYVVQNVFVSIQ